MADVLVVDDDRDIRFLLEMALGAAGHEVRLLASGRDVLSLLRDDAGLRSRGPVVVLDVQMPDLDGWQVLQHIRTDDELRDTRVILCTVRASERDVERGWALGCDAYQAKPFDLAALVAEVATLAATPIEELAHRRARRGVPR